ncbi:MAG: hypothetical protein ACTTJG_08815 [Treponema sp.]
MAARSSTGLEIVVFTLTTPSTRSSTPKKESYAETPLTKIDLQFDELFSHQHSFSHHECSERHSDHE